jgi:polar amino acid transport system substrate-binding protein
MKWIVSGVCVAACLLAASVCFLSGCGGGNNSAGSDGKPDGSLERVKKAGVLKWSADASGGAPFVFEKDNAVIGFEVEIMEKLAQHMGVKQERQQAEWKALVDHMGSGRSDVAFNGLEANEDRKQAALLSIPYCAYEQQLTVRDEDKDKYKSLDDLKGKRIATLAGAESNNVLKQAGWTEALLQPMDDSSQPYDELANKRAEAVLQESCIAGYYVFNRPAANGKLHNIPKTFSPGNYVGVFRKGDETLRKEVDRVLELMRKNGELAEIYKKWNIWDDSQKKLGIEEKK